MRGEKRKGNQEKKERKSEARETGAEIKEREKGAMPSQTREGREADNQQWQADELY